MNLKYKVVFTDTAKHDLREITLWIAQKSQDKEIAKGFVNELRTECRKLESFPNRGFLPKDRILKSLGYRFLVYKDYLIFFLAEEENRGVNVMAVFNAKKDYMRVMRKFI